MKKALLLLLLTTLTAPLAAKVRLPSVVGSSMVLQRHAEAAVWGWTEPGRTVRVTPSWDGRTRKTSADTEGRWSVRLATPEAGGPYSIKIDDGEPVVLDDILIGEVWVCSGQSNMEMPMRGFDSQPVHNALATLMEADAYPRIRLFHVARATASTPQENCVGQWERSSIASAADFSAAGYHFGLALAKALRIPVGLIESDWGATRIETWMSPEAAQSVDPEILSTNAEHDAQNQVGALYNAMIRPLTPFAVRGFLWYQGESNKGFHAKYPRDMAAMVADWRGAWGGGESMPFYYVQLAPFDYDIPMHRFRGAINPILLPLMVEAQSEALGLIPNADMAVNTDLGDAKQIHPSRKDLTGQRLALLALTKTYGKSGIDCRGPQMEKTEFDNGKAIVTFRSQSTLLPIDTPLLGFEIAGADRVFHPAEARVVHRSYDFSRRVEVWSEAVSEPVAVRYAFRNIVEVNLTNTIGLPAFPFRSDEWDDIW